LSSKIYIGKKFAYLPGVKAAVTIGTTQTIFEKPDAEPESIKVQGKELPKFVPWGENNSMPTEVIDKVYKSELVSSNLLFNINIGYGSGIEYGYISRDDKGKKIFTPTEDAEIDQFFERNDIPGYLLQQLTDMNFFFNSFSELILNSDTDGKRKVVCLTSKQAAFSRVSERNPKTGLVEYHYYSSKWPEGKPNENEVIATKSLNEYDTITDALQRIGKEPDADGKKLDQKDNKYIIHVKFPTPGKIYYSKPYWWSIFLSSWYDFAIAIPEYKRYIMQNQAAIKYHIELDDKYFDKIFSQEGIKDDKKKRERIKKEYQDINDFLSNTKNSGKSVISYRRYSPDGKEMSSLKINVIENHYKGGEYIEDSEETSSILSYAMGVHPSIVGSAPGKNKSINGTEARELFIIKQALAQSIRHRILKPLYVTKAINGWDPKIRFEIPNLVLTTLDKNTGSEKIIS
jgi:hypothetical protein